MTLNGNQYSQHDINNAAWYAMRQGSHFLLFNSDDNDEKGAFVIHDDELDIIDWIDRTIKTFEPEDVNLTLRVYKSYADAVRGLLEEVDSK
jgi:hypothetical protein